MTFAYHAQFTVDVISAGPLDARDSDARSAAFMLSLMSSGAGCDLCLPQYRRQQDVTSAHLFKNIHRFT